jgi:hypothetical protein
VGGGVGYGGSASVSTAQLVFNAETKQLKLTTL